MLPAAVSINTRLRQPASTSFAADLVTVDAGKVAVEHDHVVVVDAARVRDPPAPSRATSTAMPLPPQADARRVGHLLVVLDHQYPHRHSSRTTSTRFPRAVSPHPVFRMPRRSGFGVEIAPKGHRRYVSETTAADNGNAQRVITPA